jgi:NAD(P)-dependent dehydrogenase (short-subunit alcohol dehydrogenase family)
MEVMPLFKNKSAVVLGASARGNCGWEIATQLADQGARVTVGARRIAGVQELAGLINGLAVRCDASVEAEVEAMAEAAVAAHGPIDVAIMAAGVPFVGTIDAIPPETIRQAIDINFFGPFHFVKHMARRMRDGGAMVVITSTTTSQPLVGYSSYGCAKGATGVLIKYAALEYAPRGIRVNAVQPGIIETPMTSVLQANDAAWKAVLKEIPLGRAVKAGEVASACLWLCSPHAAVTGATLTVDNGNHLLRQVKPEELPYAVMAENAVVADRSSEAMSGKARS